MTDNIISAITLTFIGSAYALVAYHDYKNAFPTPPEPYIDPTPQNSLDHFLAGWADTGLPTGSLVPMNPLPNSRIPALASDYSSSYQDVVLSQAHATQNSGFLDLQPAFLHPTNVAPAIELFEPKARLISASSFYSETIVPSFFRAHCDPMILFNNIRGSVSDAHYRQLYELFKSYMISTTAEGKIMTQEIFLKYIVDLASHKQMHVQKFLFSLSDNTAFYERYIACFY